MIIMDNRSFFLLSYQKLESPTLLGEVNTSARLTCLAVWIPSSVQQTDEKPASEATTSKGDEQSLLYSLFLYYEEKKMFYLLFFLSANKLEISFNAKYL